MRRPRTETIKFLTQDESKRLFSAIHDKRDRAIFLIAYRHGLNDVIYFNPAEPSWVVGINVLPR